MHFTQCISLGLAATSMTMASAIPTVKRSGSISITPHEQFSSSIGVLGCKINTNRVAYWPSFPGCDNMCVKVSSNGRYVHLLKIDQSGGAYDISYDAWNFLLTGKSATEDPQMGGGMDATYEEVPMSQCHHLIHTEDKKLAFSAANSMNFVAACVANPWFADHYALYNIDTSACTYGVDELCTPPDLAAGFNQPICANTLGIQTPMTAVADQVMNVQYGTGKLVRAL